MTQLTPKRKAALDAALRILTNAVHDLRYGVPEDMLYRDCFKHVMKRPLYTDIVSIAVLKGYIRRDRGWLKRPRTESQDTLDI